MTTAVILAHDNQKKPKNLVPSHILENSESAFFWDTLYQAGMIENHSTKMKKYECKQSHKGPVATKTGKMEQQGLGVTSPQTTSQGWAPVVPG